MASWVRRKDPPSYETAELIIGGIIPMFLIVFGTVGNIISIIVLLNKENRLTATNIYLMFLCLADTISLYQWNLSNAFTTFTDEQKQIWGQSLFMCQLSQFFSFYTLHTSAMFLTFVELDRACLLRSRWYKMKIARPSIALIICVMILITLFGLNGFLFGLGFQYSTYNNRTVIVQKVVACFYSLNVGLNSFFNTYYPWNQIIGHDYTDTVFLATNALMYTRNAMNVFFLYMSVYGFRLQTRKFVLECCGKLLNRGEARHPTTKRHIVGTMVAI